MKKSNSLSNSNLLKFDIKMQNKALWKGVNFYFNQKVLDFFSSVISSTIKKNTLVSVLLTDDYNMKKINKKWRKKDNPTNVLSFPVNMDIIEDEYCFIGDVALSYETIEKESDERMISFQNHFIHLLLHGLLHLLGYSHESEKETKDMKKLEIKLLSSINIQNPYLIKLSKDY